MRRIHISRLVFALALLGLATAPLAAQQGQQTHTVKKGDTLWDLAQTYLGDPFRWPEIYRLNTATVQDPNLIYPDQVLVISGEAAATPGTPADTAMAADTSMAARAAMDTSAVDTTAVAQGEQPVYVQKPMTIFNPARYKVVRGEREALSLRSRSSAVRSGDYLRAPFLTEASGVQGAGKVDATTSAEGISTQFTVRSVQPYDRVYVQLPSGVTGERDQRYLTFREGPAIQGEGRIIVPTGVVRLTGASQAGRAEALLLTKFEDVQPGQGVMALDTIPENPGVFPSRVEFGTQTKLIWIYEEPVLPSIGNHVIFAAGAADGIVPGDQITVQREMGVDAKGVPLPPEDVAVAQVTRVTAQGTSAVIIGVNDSGLLKGQAARVTAKMP
jgi:LysM repeat protein